MRLLHVADVHLERPFRGIGHARGNERRQELRDAFARVVTLARERRVDALCIAGDPFERENAPPAIAEFLQSQFARLAPIRVLIAPGNHDYVSPGSLYDRHDWSANVQIFREPALTPVSVADGTIWGAAFTGPERHTSPLDGFSGARPGPAVGLFHADVVAPGATSSYGPFDPAGIAPSGLTFAMLGHVHAGRLDHAHHFAYPGSLEPLDVSETGPRWALLIEVGVAGVAVEPIEIARRGVIAESFDITEITTRQELAEVIAARRDAWTGNDVALRVVGTLQGELAANPSLIRAGLDGLVSRLDVVAEPFPDLDDLASQPTTLGLFVRRAREKIATAADPAEQDRWHAALRAGVAAFKGQPEFLP